MNVNYINLAVTWSDISLSVSFVLPYLHAVDVWVFEYTLVHNHKLAIKARVDLQVLWSLYADSLEKLIVKRIDDYFQVLSVRNICIILDKDFFLVVSEKSTSVCPEQTGVYG